MRRGPATFTPIETFEGKRYKVEGRIATGALLQVLPDPQRECPQGDTRNKAPGASGAFALQIQLVA